MFARQLFCCASLLSLVQLFEIIPLVSALSSPVSFVAQVERWLSASCVSFQTRTGVPGGDDTTYDPLQVGSSYSSTILELHGEKSESSLLLHLIASPRSIEECVPPRQKRDWTDTMQHRSSGSSHLQKIIHLHQDLWEGSKATIVKSRLLANLGRVSRRIYGRKTRVQKVNATVARDFLEINHLWGATGAKHAYGLFWNQTKSSTCQESLVAVATFSNKRKVVRSGSTFRSYELLRVCSKLDMTVVGGISKLIKAFVRDYNPDDIVTVVDRDWGDGSGWHSFGFETVAVLDPIVLAINPSDPNPIRRHLIGAGISSDDGCESKDGGRLGLPSLVLTELELATNASEALDVLASNSFFPLFDSGVERLFKVINRSTDTSALHLWENSKPKYAKEYYSRNFGIAMLLQYAAGGDTPKPT